VRLWKRCYDSRPFFFPPYILGMGDDENMGRHFFIFAWSACLLPLRSCVFSLSFSPITRETSPGSLPLVNDKIPHVFTHYLARFHRKSEYFVPFSGCFPEDLGTGIVTQPFSSHCILGNIEICELSLMTPLLVTRLCAKPSALYPHSYCILFKVQRKQKSFLISAPTVRCRLT